MSAAAKATAKKVGKRYSPEEKKEIIAFIEKHNSEKGRGGQSAAVAKFGVSALTLSAWVKAGGDAVPSGKKRGRKPGSKNLKPTISTGGSFSKKLTALSLLAAQIDNAESDIAKLKAKFQALKAGL